MIWQLYLFLKACKVKFIIEKSNADRIDSMNEIISVTFEKRNAFFINF